ncbi:hypothetical protein [Roseateles sp.]|uniref:hypothetical protein n=1 Tax=Roseateles sp. TaxID=1971397 RepID=UPI003263C622
MTFGYKTAWFAIRATDREAVARALGLKHLTPAPADAAITAAYREPGKVFVTPALDGWTLAMSSGFLTLAEGTPPPFLDRLRRVSAELGTEAQFFASHRVVELHAWGRAALGQLDRAYCYCGHSGETSVDAGNQTTQEVQLGHSFYDSSSPEARTDAYWERDDLRFANEEDVMEVAGLWSVNPQSLEDLREGFLADGELPAVPAAPAVPAPAKKPLWRFW